MSSSSSKKIFGLDILRALAVIFVFIDHCKYSIKSVIPSDFQVDLPLGSDLFLVLSGYLIGKSIIREYTKNESPGFSFTFNFLLRRWFRTLPNYYLFLLLNILLIYFGLIAGTVNKYVITYFVFFQNFFKPYDFLYWESWTLVVQEWFYLLFPIFTYLIVRYSPKKFGFQKKIAFVICLFIFLPVLYRLQVGPSLDKDLFIRKIVLARLDSIGYGLIAAYVHFYFGAIWSRFKNPFFFIGLVFILLIENIAINNQLYTRIFELPLLSLSIALLLPKLESIKEEKIPFKPIQFISKISFSIYLIHSPVNQILMKYIPISSGISAVLFILIYAAITLVLSYINYTYFEVYFMNLRERLYIKS